MNTDNNKEPVLRPKNLTPEEIRNGCITMAGKDGKETKLCMIQEEFRNGIDGIKQFNPSVTFYGSARMPKDHPFFQKIRDLAYLISKELGYAIITGGGNGVMEAANKGAYEAGGVSVGATISLPYENKKNDYLTYEVPFNFFFARQVSMYFSTEVCIFCPGGFGTFAELFEVLTHLQTEKLGGVPVILYGTDFWKPLQDFIDSTLLEKYKTISSEDLNLYIITDDDEKILEVIRVSKIRDGTDSLR